MKPTIHDARCVLLAVLRPDWLEMVEADEEAGVLVIHASDTEAARQALGERSCVAGWPVEVRRVTPR